MKKVIGLFVVLSLFLVSSGFLVSAVGSWDSVNFTTQGWTCETDGGSNSRWVNYNSQYDFSVESISPYQAFAEKKDPTAGNSALGCFKDINGDGKISGENEFCCPSDSQSCLIVDEDIGRGECGGNALYCADFNNGENECNAARYARGIASVADWASAQGISVGDDSWVDSSGGSCVNSTNIKCAWDDDNNSCYALAVRNDSWSPDPTNPCKVGSVSASCAFSAKTTEDLCDKVEHAIRTVMDIEVVPGSVNGMTEAEAKAYCDPDEGEPDMKYIQDYECSASLRLPFFSGFSFVISLLGIFFIYFIFRKK